MAFDYYFAGATTERIEKVIVSLGGNVLKSYVVDKALLNRWFQYKRDGWTGKLMIDNGEFTLHRHGGSVDIDEYIEYLNKNDAYIDYAVALDKIPGVWGTTHTQADIDSASDITYQNFLYMRERCKSPKKLIPVFHQEERFSALTRLLLIDDLEYLCISGRKDLTAASRRQFYSEVFDIIINSPNPNIRVHCLGSGTLTDMKLFPFSSSDSTSCNMVAANGKIFVKGIPTYVGDGGKQLLTDERNLIIRECEQSGIKFSDLINYQDRAIMNIMFMYMSSRQTNFINRNLRKARLF